MMMEGLTTREKLNKARPALILFFIPLLFTLLFGAVMSNIFVENIPIAVYDLDNSPKSRTIVDNLYDCKTFVISEDVFSEEELREQILSGKVHGGVIIPKGFGDSLAAKQGTEVLVLIDGSNFLIGNNITLFTTTVFTMANASIQMTLLEAGDMAPYMAEQNVYTLNLADRTLYNPQLGYFYYLFAGLLGIFVQQTFLAVTPAVLLEEKLRLYRLPDNFDREAQKMKLGGVIAKLAMYAVLNTASMFLCLVLANVFFAYPINGSIGYVLLIHIIFQLCLFGMALVLATLFDDVTHCIQFVMFLAIPTFLSSGYGWPEFMMAPGFAQVMKLFCPLYYYNNPMKELMLKGAGMEVIGKYVVGGLNFAAVWIPIGCLLYFYKIKNSRRAGLAPVEPNGSHFGGSGD